MTENVSKFIAGKRGFDFFFENGMRISVKFHRDNYCNNRGKKEDEEKEYNECENAEIALFFRNQFVTRLFYRYMCKKELGDDVLGYVTPNELSEIIYNVANIDASKIFWFIDVKEED